jgi:kinesin family member 11
VLSQSKSISNETNKFSAEIDGFVKSATQSVIKLRSEAEQHQTREVETLTAHSNRINEQIQRMQEAVQTIQAKDEASSEAIASAQLAIKEVLEGIRSDFASWSEKFKLSSSSMYTEIERASLTGYQTVSHLWR